MNRAFTAIATRVASFAGQPAAFAAALLAIIVWAATGPIFGYSDTWQLIVNTSTTIITFLMVFVIQNSQNRDGAALQAKLDELLRTVEGADEDFIGIEHMSDKQLERLRSAIERKARERGNTGDPSTYSIERMIERF